MKQARNNLREFRTEMVDSQSWINGLDLDAVDRPRPPIVEQADPHSSSSRASAFAPTHDQKAERLAEGLEKLVGSSGSNSAEGAWPTKSKIPSDPVGDSPQEIRGRCKAQDVPSNML